MSYLLDTHVVWSHASEGEGLSPNADKLLLQARVRDLHVLDLSLYELARHMEIGTIEVDSPLRALQLLENAYPIVRSDASIAWSSIHMEWPKRNGKGEHRDPADRAIMATAMLRGLTVITADREMHTQAKRVGVPIVW